ncbi:MAG: hypothetical protein U9Q81_22345 [Pseudomonadota bacterium]|nr:hypothetical protein [Pseudomonadota bacterium]
MSDRTPQAVQDCRELIRWLVPQLDEFLRMRRYTLGERLEQALLDVLELLLEAACTRAKQHRRVEQAKRFHRLPP